MKALDLIVDSLSEVLHNKRRRKSESYLEYISTDDNEVIWKCIDSSKNYKLHFTKDLINRFANTYEFCTKDIHILILLLWKGIYIYEYMNGWKRFDKTLLHNEEDFYSSLSMEDTRDAD